MGLDFSDGVSDRGPSKSLFLQYHEVRSAWALVNIIDVDVAAGRIRPYIHETPLVGSGFFSSMVGASCYFKLENWQKTGSFKIRGALNAFLSYPEIQKRGCITASAGNHGQAVAYAARALGVPAVVVVPEAAPEVKVAAIKGYGAEVIKCGGDSEERRSLARRLAAERQMMFLHSFDDPFVIAGQGTCALEIMAQLPEANAIIVPISGGGLAGGVSLIKERFPHVKIIGVEPEGSACMQLSLQHETISTFPVKETLADGLMAIRPGKITFDLAQKYIDSVITVSEAEIWSALRLMLGRMKVLAEPSGAVSVAGLLKMGHRLAEQNVVAVVSGGNMDLELLGKLLTEAYVLG